MISIFACTATAVGVTFKMASETGETVGEFAIVRSGTMLVLSQPVRLLFGKKACDDLPRDKVPHVILRSLFGVSTFVLGTWALTIIPLSLQTILFNLNPFWCSILGYLINGEKVARLEYICMAVAFLGVIGICFGADKTETDATSVAVGTTILGIVVAFASSWTLASSNILNRIIKDIHFTVVMTYHTMIGTTATFIPTALVCLLTHQTFLSYSSSQWGLMMLGGLFEFITVATNIVAFQSDNSAFVSLIGYIQVPLAFLADYVIFG